MNEQQQSANNPTRRGHPAEHDRPGYQCWCGVMHWRGDGSRPDQSRSRPIPIIAILLAVATILTMWSFSDPHVNIPIVSQVVCSIKGGTWYNSSLLIPAGCYARARIGGQSQATPPTTAVPAADPNVSVESEDHASPGDSVACRTWATGSGEFDEQAYQECMQFGAP